jgi:hypothetical protein
MIQAETAAVRKQKEYFGEYLKTFLVGNLAWRLEDQAQVAGASGDLRPVADPQFADDIADMLLCCGQGNRKLLRDLLVGCAAREELHDLQLARAERLDQRSSDRDWLAWEVITASLKAAISLPV